MFSKLSFYARHSYNDLRVNGQRTFFALLCIAAGVAAIVSLQTLASMISGTLTGNLQENNRGDIVAVPSSNFTSDDALLNRGLDDGVLEAETISFFGQSETEYRIGASGLEALQAWIDENYRGRISLTYRQILSDMGSIFLGTGNGSAVTALGSGTVVTSVSPVVVDASVYPYYSDVRTLDGTPLDEVLNGPTDIVLSEKVADDLGVRVGDTVRLTGAEADFTVRGVVSASAEVKNPGSDIFLALFGFYYLDHSAAALFPNVRTQADRVFLRIDDPTPELVNAANTRFGESFPYLETTTTEDLRQNYTDLSRAIEQLVTIMGLVSLLVGSIGIINTMQVIVRRRTVEVAVLKTIGLQANQVTTLFLVEAVIMGIIGSLAGIVLGWAATFLVKGAAETLLATDLPFRISITAAINGFVVGVLVTTVFGFLPTLTAGQVRPGLVLRPSDNIVPRAGILRSLLALAVVIFALTIIAQSILGSFQLAFMVIVGAFFAVGFLYALLSLLVWLVGRFFPSFGLVDLKISLRQMLASRSRAAITLLALVIGVFALSLITLFADSIAGLLENALDEAVGGNVTISLDSPDRLAAVETIVEAQQGVNSYRSVQNYSLTLVSLTEGDTGRVIDLDQLAERLAENPDTRFGDLQVNRLELLRAEVQTIDMLPETEFADSTMASGRLPTAADSGLPYVVVVESETTKDAGIRVGDFLNYAYGDQTVTVEVIGLEARGFISINFGSSTYALNGALGDLPASGAVVIVDIAEESISDLRLALAAVPGTFVLENSLLTNIINSLLGTFTAFPTMVALLGLIVGGVVIANSVALTTMERRREIAVMKAVGLQRERVLGMLLLENGIMGVIGGLIGVGIGLINLIVLAGMINLPLSAIAFSTALLLMGLCVVVALIAAMTTAWGASGEKPLNVLRYE